MTERSGGMGCNPLTCAEDEWVSMEFVGVGGFIGLFRAVGM
jgi:hypothetical protein